VLWRVNQLGWTSEKFQNVDKSIETERHHYGRVVDEHDKVDRYGKKYSWIAYFELAGWLQDEGLLSGRKDNGRTWDVDLDPSLPSPTQEHKLISDDFLGKPNMSFKTWIKKGPTPDLRPYFRQASILSVSGPWIALDGIIVQQDEIRGRRLFAFLRSFLVKQNEATKLTARLIKQSLGGRWLPEKPQVLYTFVGEVPWCDTFPQNEPSELHIVTKEWKVKTKRKRPWVFLDEKPVDLQVIDLLRHRMFGSPPGAESDNVHLTKADLARVQVRDRIVEVEEVQKKFRKFRTLIPVVDIGFEGRTVENTSPSGVTLAKQLALMSGLCNLPQTHDLRTKNGVRATCGITDGEDFNNHQRFFFIREDILRDLLRRRGESLIWAIWGERELSYKQIERARPDKDLAGLGYANFQSIHRY
jgi:hypothetical protein